MDEKLQALVSQLLNEGKSEEEIRDFIRQYKEENVEELAFSADSSGFDFGKTNVYGKNTVVYGQNVDENDRNAFDVIGSYGASLGRGVVSIIDDFTKLYETGEGGIFTEFLFENPLQATAGYAASYLRDKGYEVPKEIRGLIGGNIYTNYFDLSSPKERRELYETHMLNSRDEGLTLEQAQMLDPTNRLKFESILGWFDEHTYTYKDKNGNPMDYLSLFNEGRYGAAADAFINDAFGAVPSLVVSRLPYGSGAAILGAGAYMDNFEREMFKRGFNDETTRNDIIKDSYITGASDFILELIGGRIINNIIGKGIPKQKAIDLLTNMPKVIAQKFGLGYISEFTTEGLTGVVQTQSKNWSYGDKVNFNQRLRVFFKDGFIGGFLGGGATVLSTPNKRQVYDYVATDQYKQEQLKIEEEIVGLTRSYDKADGTAKTIIEKQIKELQDKKEVNKANLYNFFDSLTKKAKKEYAKNLDKKHEQLDIMLDNRIDNKTREKAKKEYQKTIEANNRFFKGTDINYDAKTEAFLGKVLKNTEKILEAKKIFGFDKSSLDIEYVTSEARIKELNDKFEGFNSADGMFYDNTDGKNKIYINQNVAAVTGQTNVLGHEYLHAIVSRSFSGKIGKSALKGSISEFVKYLNDIGEVETVALIEARLATQYDALDSDGNIIRDNHGLVKTKNEANQEEYFNIFSDIIKQEKIEAVENKSGGIKNSFRTLVRGLGFGEIDFQNGQEVFDFLVDYNSNISRASMLNKLTSRRIAKVKLKGLEPKEDKRFKEGTDVLKAGTKKSVVKKDLTPKQATDEVNKIGKTNEFGDNLEGKDGNAMWEAVEGDDAARRIQEQGLLDKLILKKLHVGVDDASFLNATYAALLPHIRNYKPERKNPNGLFGWINPQIANKATQAYNSLQKGKTTQPTVDIGQTTKEGEVKIQVAAETDAPTKALETEDLSIAARIKRKVEANKKKIQKTSKFRKVLSIETGGEIYNRVLDSARKALIRAYESGKPARNVQRNLRNEANTYLFKTVKNFLGTNTYISNLKNFREAIVDVMFTADLVQLEREVADNKKVFTKFVKQLTSKEQVQNAVDQNLLPPSALNTIDKGQAVNLYKKVMPTEEQFIKFFDQPAINPVTGKRSGLKGTRKDQLAKYMSGALAYDATMEVAQEPEVMQKRADIAALNGETLAEDNIQALADQINRDPNVKFSLSTPAYKKGFAIIYGQDKNDGFMGKNFQKYLDNKDIDGVTKRTVIDEYVKRAQEQFNISEDAISKKELNAIKKNIPIHRKYELIASNRLKDIFKKAGYSKVYKVKKLSEKDNNPDVVVTKNGKTVLAIEIKGNTARGVSVTFNYKGKNKKLEKTKLAQEKQETDNYFQKEKLLVETANKVFNDIINVIEQTIGKDGYRYSNFDNLQLTQDAVNIIKKQGVHLPIFKNIQFITTSDVANSYQQKKGKDGNLKPSHVIDMGNAGMFNMSVDSELQIEGLSNFADQKAPIPLVARVNFASLNKAKTHRTTSIRIESQLNSLFFEKQNASLINKKDNKNVNFKLSKSQEISDKITLANKAIENARKTSSFSKTKGASIFDFDETVGISENFVIAKKGNLTEKIASEDWPLVGETLKEQGYEFDFTDFNKVTKGKPGPLLQKMKNQIDKYGSKNVFILTARAPESQQAIHDWLESEGAKIPLENITGLGDSTGEAKAMWVLDKYANEGYNDIYFVDDALQNVQAVENVLKQLNVKRKVQRAVTVKFSKSGMSELTDSKEYKSFRNKINNRKIYHGGTKNLTDPKIKDKDFVTWFYINDKQGSSEAQTMAELWGINAQKSSGIYESSVDLLENQLIVPDMNDVPAFQTWVQENYPDIVPTKYKGFDGRQYKSVDILSILNHKDKFKILKDWITWTTDKKNAADIQDVTGENLYDDNGGISNVWPVIVIGKFNKNNITKIKLSEEGKQEIKNLKKYGGVKVKFSKSSLRGNKAVKNVLDQLDVKGKSVQAKIKFSKSIDKSFNKILQDVSGIDAKKVFSEAKAKKRGEGKGRFRLFVPPSHEDFVGLLYNFMGKGEKGNKHRAFFEKALIEPLNRAYRELNIAKQAIANDYKNLVKQVPDMRKKLTEKTPDGDFTYSDAVRVYLWDKAGFEIPGLSKTDKKALVELVNLDGKLKRFALKIGLISRIKEGYIEPNEHWITGDIRTDLADATGRVGRKKFFAEFIENADIVFSKENINKIRAIYGDNFVEALQDVLYRTKNGTNRTVGPNRIVNGFLDYINGSIGATMFFNARSAVLQTLSTVNFINYGDNNVFKAAAAFADQKQFWKDFAMLFNSDMLKQRRAGVAFDVNAAEIASAVSKSKQPVRAAIAHLLQLGFLPTQIADSFAISTGGATMYRNRVNTYLKQGLSKKEAEAKAFTDFQIVAESTQQSARPDMISQQQASVLGRMILAFQNTPSQYVRLIKKAGSDLINRRKTPPYSSQTKSDMSNISRIIYYGAVQNVIFYGLQSALFAMLFDDEEDEKTEKFFKTKKQRVIQGSIDTILRGMGVGGAVISTIKNTVIKYHEEQGKTWNKKLGVISNELLQISPPIGIKKRKLDKFEETMLYNKKVIPEMNTFDIDNPVWGAYAQLVEGATNIPVNRLHTKVQNVRAALDTENAWWQRLATGLGWNKWDVGIENKEIKAVKEDLKINNKKRKKTSRIKAAQEDMSYDNLKALNKQEQINMLLKLGYSKRQAYSLRYEDDRVNKIIQLSKKSK